MSVAQQHFHCEAAGAKVGDRAIVLEDNVYHLNQLLMSLAKDTDLKLRAALLSVKGR